MALADYFLCSKCERKCFYDADVYERYTEGHDENYNCGQIRALCKQCAEDYQLIITRKSDNG